MYTFCFKDSFFIHSLTIAAVSLSDAKERLSIIIGEFAVNNQVNKIYFTESIYIL